MIAEQKEDGSMPKGRKQTDKSLNAERAKADASTAIGSKRAERQTDDIVFANRAEADEAKFRAREYVNDTNNAERHVSDETLDLSLDADERLGQERQACDEALEIERRDMDAALEQEREQKRMVEQKLFQMERQETDKNLTEERNQTDIEAQRVAKVLSDERDAHVATRAELTTRDEFLAIVSHDLKNPLSSISMAVDFLTESSFYAEADDEARDYLDIVGRNTREALRLIGDLLDMERMAVGKLGLQIEHYDICEIVRHSIDTLYSKAATKNQSIRFSSESAMAMCDRDRISQVLSNLIANAIKFTPTGGAITIRVQPSDTEVLISVADTGPGIPKDMRKKVFERFWQIGKPDRRGLGLGLYISTMIVETHGGRIWVDSEVQSGSTFNFTLPQVLSENI